MSRAPAAARTDYEEAAELCHPDLRCFAEAANNSGWASAQLAEFVPARRRLEQAAESWRVIGDGFHEGQTLSNLGVLFARTGDLKSAIRVNNRAADLLKGRDPVAFGRVLNNLGLCRLALGQYALAATLFSQAIAREGSRKDAAADVVLARMNLGRARMLSGQLVAAEGILNQALDGARRQPSRATLALVLNNLGQVLWRRRRLKAAEEKLREALDLHEATGDKRGASAALHHLGLTAVERTDFAEARRLLRRAIDLRTSCGLRDDAADSFASLAELELREGHLAVARNLAESATTLLESVRSMVPGPELRASYYARRRRLLDVSVEAALRSPDGSPQADGLLAAERGRARGLLDLLSEGSIVDSVSAPLHREREAVQSEINLLSWRLATAPPTLEKDLRRRIQLQLDRNSDLDMRIRVSVDDAQAAKPLHSVALLQTEILASDSMLLVYHLGEERGHLWIVRRDSLRLADLPPRKEIDAQANLVANLFGRILDRRRSPALNNSFEGSMRRLSAMLLGPLRGTPLPPRLILVLDGSLHFVPFAALRLPDSSRYLGLQHELIRTPSAGYLQAGRAPRNPSDFPASILTIGDPVFSIEDARVPEDVRKRLANVTASDLPRLAFHSEMDTIASLIPPLRRRALTGFEATFARMKHLRLEDFGLIHFSTHAIIDDQVPDLSRMVLSMLDRSGRPVDGFVHPHQLATLRLNGSTVVLAACRSALGKLVMGEGLQGMTSSLFHAGAAQLVLSLAKVDAEASSEFFSLVYRHLFTGPPISVERALLQARRTIARRKDRSDPYYWAAFAVIGRPHELPGRRANL